MRWLVIALVFVGCAATASQPRTSMETRAYTAYDQCWRAGGSPTPEFVATEYQGRVYAILGGNVGVTSRQLDAIAACMAVAGVTPTWGPPPNLFGR